MIKFKNKPIDAPSLPVTAVQTDKGTADQGDHEPIFQITDFAQNYVTYHVHKHTASERPARPHNVVHASDLDPVRHWCPREPARLTLHNKKRPAGFLSTAQRMTFGMGYKGADLLMQCIPPEKVWGHWKCRACKHTMDFRYTPDKCEKCGGDRGALKYKEVFLRDPASGVVGSVDCFVDILGNGTKTPIEIKTEGNEGFKARSSATFDHEWRTMLYLWLIEQTPWAKGRGMNHQQGRVIYFTKEGYADEPKIKEWKLQDWAKSAIKEYWVHRNDDMIENALNRAIEYRAWRNSFDIGAEASVLTKVLPARVEKCTSIACTRAADCPVRKECWKGSPQT